MTATTSSNVVAHGYDAETQTLAIQFKSGLYHYIGVPADVAERLRSAESIGSFIAKEVRPVFDAVKQEPKETAL